MSYVHSPGRPGKNRGDPLKPGDGVMFENQNRRGERDPNLTGRMGTRAGDRWLAGWWNTSKAGTHYLRIVVGRPVEDRDTEEHPATTNPIGDAQPMARSYVPPRAVASAPPGIGPPGNGAPPRQAQPPAEPPPDDDIPF